MTITLPPALYTPSECAKILGFKSRTYIYKLVKDGKLDAEIDATGRMRISREEIYRYAKSKD